MRKARCQGLDTRNKYSDRYKLCASHRITDMDTRQDYINKYNAFKKLIGGQKPLKKEFLQHYKIKELHLLRIFGKDPYSTLQQECGDKPNKLELVRTELSEILDKYGELARQHKRIPVQADWYAADYFPRPDGIKKVHKLSFLTLPEVFVENYKDKAEWKDVIKILTRSNKATSEDKKNRAFIEIVDKINYWTPDRKRVLEEGYKIELRKYLEKSFDVEEEVGDSNADLLINKKYPIEIKKDPSTSEYDRLLGQMIRHNKQYGSAIAVVTSLSSQDRFMKFQKLFIDVHDRLGMIAELISK